MTVADNIKELRRRFDITQSELARVAGVTENAVSKWENGYAVPRMGAIERIALCYGVTKGSLIEDGGIVMRGGRSTPSGSGLVEVPLLARIAAGTPMEMEDYSDSFPIPSRVRDKYPEAFLLRVDGESMNRVIPNGCYALVDPCHEVLHDGKPYAVCVNGYDATIKRVRKLNNGFELVPDSTDPTFSKATYNYNEPGTETITIIGEVVYYVLPYDWGF